jgi:squalene-hopene/tetraprenyl-beta-curcumene cyclase
MKSAALRIVFVAACVGACFIAFHRRANAETSWNPKAAAAYLDQREGWWMNWPHAARDHGTFCVSCHTAVPYALSQTALHGVLPARAASVNEQKLIDNVTKRVRLWQDVQPYYRDSPAKSRGTEAVLNALILASHDSQEGKLSTDTRAAFDDMWALQITMGDERGAWSWIQFDNEPWEAPDSQYYGAALGAIAVGSAPENYRSSPEIQNYIRLLKDYLDREYAAQSPINHVVLLWASAKLPGLLAPEQQRLIINEILDKQQTNGGWGLSSLVGSWKRSDGTPQVTDSDGYATGLATLALLQAGVSRDDPHVERGLSWLIRNQSAWGGHWSAYSLNRRRHNPFSDVSRFMDDAATAYAVLALTQAKSEPDKLATR